MGQNTAGRILPIYTPRSTINHLEAVLLDYEAPWLAVLAQGVDHYQVIPNFCARGINCDFHTWAVAGRNNNTVASVYNDQDSLVDQHQLFTHEQFEDYLSRVPKTLAVESHPGLEFPLAPSQQTGHRTYHSNVDTSGYYAAEGQQVHFWAAQSGFSWGEVRFYTDGRSHDAAWLTIHTRNINLPFSSISINHIGVNAAMELEKTENTSYIVLNRAGGGRHPLYSAANTNLVLTGQVVNGAIHGQFVIQNTDNGSDRAIGLAFHMGEGGHLIIPPDDDDEDSEGPS